MGHSLASRGINTKYNIINHSPELLMSNKDFEEMIFDSVICENGTMEERNDYDDYYGICSLNIHKIIYLDTSGYEYEAIIEGTVGGVHGKYWMRHSYYAGSYEDPPDAEFEWSSVEERIKELQKTIGQSKHVPFIQSQYKKELSELIEIIKE